MTDYQIYFYYDPDNCEFIGNLNQWLWPQEDVKW